MSEVEEVTPSSCFPWEDGWKLWTIVLKYIFNATLSENCDFLIKENIPY